MLTEGAWMDQNQARGCWSKGSKPWQEFSAVQMEKFHKCCFRESPVCAGCEGAGREFKVMSRAEGWAGRFAWNLFLGEFGTQNLQPLALPGNLDKAALEIFLLCACFPSFCLFYPRCYWGSRGFFGEKGSNSMRAEWIKTAFLKIHVLSVFTCCIFPVPSSLSGCSETEKNTFNLDTG